MPYAALYHNQVQPPEDVPIKTDCYCPECGDPMRVVREGADGTDRHFRHKTAKSGGGGASNRCSQRKSGGESEEHIRMKNSAAVCLAAAFHHKQAKPPANEVPLAAPASDKERRSADALIFFDEWDEQLGRGVAMEVQYKNKGKDKQAVRKDYDRQGISVVWVTPDDFNHKTHLRFEEPDIRRRARAHTSICEAVPKWETVTTEVEGRTFENIHVHQPETHEGLISREHDPREAVSSVPATIPVEWFAHELEAPLWLWLRYYDEVPKSLWRRQHWDGLFTASLAEEYLPERNDHTIKREIHLDLTREKVLHGISRSAASFGRLACARCDWISPIHPEPAGKLLTLHAKSNHKKELNNGGSYRNFVACDIRRLSPEDKRYVL